MKVRLLVAALSCMLAVGPLSAHAQDWPGKTVRVVVPGPPGSSPDRVTRTVADRLSKKWGQQVVVENRPGGTTRIGAEIVAKAQPDGYTLLSTFISHTTVKLLHPETTYDPIADFTPIVELVNPEVVLVVRADSPYKTVDDLVTDLKAKKSPLQYGHFGNGSTFHLYGLMLGKAAGIDVLPVPYKGEALQLTDLLGGHIESSFNSVGTVLPHIKEGNVRVLAILANERSKVLPDTPTFTEAGIPRLNDGGWFGLLAPANTPEPVVNKIADDVQEILKDPAVVSYLRDQGLEPSSAGPQQFARTLQKEHEQWGELIKEFNVTVN